MGMFSSNKRDLKEEAKDLRESAKSSAKGAAVAKAVGANKIAAKATRSAATKNMVARYWETDRCQLGHSNCTNKGH